MRLIEANRVNRLLEVCLEAAIALNHKGSATVVLAARHALYQQAREANPRRWSGSTRDWTPVGAVTLNPERDCVVAAATQQRLSGSTGEPAFPSRTGVPAATARSGGDGRRGAARSHAQVCLAWALDWR